MEIEDFWEDVNIYYIEFETKWTSRGTIRKIEKCIILPTSYSVEQVKKIVSTHFTKVKKINHVDYWGEGMLLKR